LRGPFDRRPHANRPDRPDRPDLSLGPVVTGHVVSMAAEIIGLAFFPLIVISIWWSDRRDKITARLQVKTEPPPAGPTPEGIRQVNEWADAEVPGYHRIQTDENGYPDWLALHGIDKGDPRDGPHPPDRDVPGDQHPPD
jgi:hypothetical protein